MVVLDGLMSSYIVSTSSVDNKNSSRWAGCASRLSPRSEARDKLPEGINQIQCGVFSFLEVFTEE